MGRGATTASSRGDPESNGGKRRGEARSRGSRRGARCGGRRIPSNSKEAGGGEAIADRGDHGEGPRRALRNGGTPDALRARGPFPSFSLPSTVDKQMDRLQGTKRRLLKKRTFFRARSAPVTGIDVCTAYPNIAKYTQHHKLFAKIPNSLPKIAYYAPYNM